MEIVQPFEFLSAAWPGQQSFEFPARDIEDHKPVLTIGDESPAVFVKLQAVWDSIVLNQDRPLFIWRNAIDPPRLDIDAKQIALTVERRPLQKSRAFAG